MKLSAALDTPSQPPTSTLYGCLMNRAPASAALSDAAHQPLYQAPPTAPVLYLQPCNTGAADGEAVAVPAGAAGSKAALQVRAALGLVIGRIACKLAVADVLAHVAGTMIVNDLSLPHDSV